MIDSHGRILTNNHVVDDGFGSLSDAFSVCISEEMHLPPKCHYTATVISRNVEKDLALLQIDALDIFGAPTIYESFTILPINYDTVVTTWDVVTARGFPLIGSSTITETQGIISGTSQHNNNTYYKTDTLIAGWNSGGPLIKWWSMIGVNTFLKWGNSDPALGYSLAIREARDFILSGLQKSVTMKNNFASFSQFLRTINTVTKEKKIIDTHISINFPHTYTLSHYSPGYILSGDISEASNFFVKSFFYLHINTPPLKTLDDARYFLSKQDFFPYSENVKLKSVQIGWRIFYQVEQLGSLSESTLSPYSLYFTIVNESHIMMLALLTPDIDSTNQATVSAHISQFLSGIQFPNTFDFPPQKPIVLPGIGVALRPHASSILDFYGNFMPYESMVLDFISNDSDVTTMKTYLWNLWSYAQISIFPHTLKWEDSRMQNLLNWFQENEEFVERKDADLIRYRWYSGLRICDKNSYNTLTDEKLSIRDVYVCEVLFLVGKDNSHFLSLMFLIEKGDVSRVDVLIKEHLDAFITLDGDGLTQLVNQQKYHTYTDVALQNEEYKKALQKLVFFGILSPKTQFDGDHPMTWNEFVRLYVWMIYRKRLSDPILPDSKTTFSQIIQKMPIILDAYVDAGQLEEFHVMANLFLSQVALPKYTYNSITDFVNQSQTKYRTEWEKIKKFQYVYFSGQKLWPDGSKTYQSGNYIPGRYIYFTPWVWLSYENTEKGDTIVFWGYSDLVAKASVEKSILCQVSVSVFFTKECVKLRQKSLMDILSYSVLTKGKAVSFLYSHVDFALWDASLAARKKVSIQQELTR